MNARFKLQVRLKHVTHRNYYSCDTGVSFYMLSYENAKIFRTEYRPRGPMDKASDFESEDCGFDPHRGQFYTTLRCLFEPGVTTPARCLVPTISALLVQW